MSALLDCRRHVAEPCRRKNAARVAITPSVHVVAHDDFDADFLLGWLDGLARAEGQQHPCRRTRLMAGILVNQGIDDAEIEQAAGRRRRRSEEHTSELQPLMRLSYAVLCLKK